METMRFCSILAEEGFPGQSGEAVVALWRSSGDGSSSSSSSSSSSGMGWVGSSPQLELSFPFVSFSRTQHKALLGRVQITLQFLGGGSVVVASGRQPGLLSKAWTR